jgi:hypothetical protein
MVGATFGVVAAAEVLRQKRGIIAQGNAQVSTTQSKFGGASAYFDGSGDSIEVGNNSDALILSGDFTIEMWFRVGNQNAYLFTNEKGTVGANKLAVYILPTVGRLDWYLGGTPALNTNASSVVINTWTHIAFVRSSNIVSCYINGVQQTATKEYSPDLGNVSTSVDTWYFGGRGSVDPMLGHLDEIRISNSARYTANFTPSTTAFVNDANTVLLIHANGTNATTFFEDDNGSRASNGLSQQNTAAISTAQSYFGGSSLSLNGSSSVNTPSSFAFGTGDFTVEYWVRSTTLSSYDIHWDLRGSNTSQLSPIVYTNGTTLYMDVGATTRITGGTLSTNTWYHIALSRSSGSTKMFINGTQTGSTYTDSNNYVAATPLYIGMSQSGSGVDGFMDEFRISNSARYTTTFTPSTTPFVNDSNTLLLCHFDGTNGSTVFRDDNGIRSQKGISAIGNAQVDTAQSKFGGASVLFDGTGDYLQLPNSNDYNFGSNAFTVEGWVRAANFTNSPSIMGMATIGQFDGWNLQFGSDGKLYMEYRNSDSPSSITIQVGTAAFSTNTWGHFAFVRSGNTIYAFKDGSLSQSASLTWSIGTSTANLIIGDGYGINTSWSASTDFNGHMDEIRISNTARYTAAFTPSTTPFQNDDNTVLLLHCDGTDASTVFFDDNGVKPYTP